jgi:integrase
VNACHQILHKCLKQALKWGLVSRNVTDLVEAPKRRKKTPKTWTAEQVNCFLEAVADHRWYPIYALAVYCGMRQGEILGLHLEDIDFQKGTIYIKHQLTYVNGQGFSITEPKTEKSKRLVTVPSSALNILRNHCIYLDPDQKLAFTTSTGNPISNRNVIRHFKAVINDLGLPDIRFHDLRHTHATLLLAAGIHPKVVQERLGHSQISMTLDTYSHVIPSLQTEASEKFETILS